jgi:diguanylate cyclase (GGDEF)-like protein
VDGGRRVVPAEVVGLPGDAAVRDIGVDQIEHTLREGRPVVSDDLAAEEHFDATALVEHGMRSSMTALVLFPDGTPYGVIAAYSSETASFAAEDLDFLQTIANVLSGALAREQAQAEMLHSSLHDPVTLLPNRALLVDRLHQAMARLARRDSYVAAMVLGVDHFKEINNTAGHHAGDLALRQLADRLQLLLRGEDTLSRGAGDEFVMLCEGLASATAIGPIAERMLEAFAEPLLVEGVEFSVSVSIGIAVAGPEWDQAPDALLRDADAALHKAKSQGRNRYEVFDEVLRAQTVTHVGVRSGLRHAVRDEQLRVVYQPIIDLRTGALAGMEALVRWEHPERGLLGPADFISVAEESQVVTEIDAWVTLEACRQLALWRGRRPDVFNGTRMAINLSGRDLCSSDLTRNVAAAIAASGIRPEHLVFEITESSLVPDPERADVVLSRMNSLGVQLALDDFGTGYSSLLHLKRFPFDMVKLDRSFVGGLATATADFAIVASVIDLARTLGLSVVAEGIESEPQLDRLRKLGCPLGQGFLFSPPVPANDLVALVERPLTSPVEAADEPSGEPVST